MKNKLFCFITEFKATHHPELAEPLHVCGKVLVNFL